MSYFTPPEVKKRLRIGLSKDDGNQPRLGCTEPTAAYGETPGVEKFEVGIARGDIEDIPESEFPERLEALERGRNTLIDRIDADWKRALTQGRCGYCWAYAVICAMQAAMARDGRPHFQFSAASVAAIVKRGRDQGGWPPEAAREIAENGVCGLDEWPDCSCRGSCRGPRGGCRARDLSQTEGTRASAARTDFRFYELPRNTGVPTIKAILQNLPVAGGWVKSGAWADGHAMGITHVMRDRRRGYMPVPENSWGMFKRRIPVEKPPTGGIVVVRASRKEAA